MTMRKLLCAAALAACGFGIAVAETIAPGLWPDFVAKDDPTLIRSLSIPQPRDGIYPHYRFVGGKAVTSTITEPKFAGALVLALPWGPLQCMEACRKDPQCAAWDMRPAQPGRKEGFQMAQRLCSTYATVPPQMSRLMRAIDDSHNVECEDMEDEQRTPCAAGVVLPGQRDKSVPKLLPGIKVKPAGAAPN